MCLAIPGEVVSLHGALEMPMAMVRFGGVEREVCLALVPEAGVGEFVLVHAGFAIAILQPEEASIILEELRSL